jgi:hypothetical protein
MSNLFERWNLRPAERRLVIIAMIVLFVVLNWLLVWPHFGALGKVRAELAKAREQLATYQTEIDRAPAHQRRLRELEGADTAVLSAEAALNLMRVVQTQANQSGVAVVGQDVRKGAPSRPTDLFEEQTMRISFNSGDKELVDFLVKLSSGNSTIRVREMSLSPDQSRTRLSGAITLVASYQKGPAAKKTALTSARTTP